MIVFIFFFQAEDGIRDIGVTGVQTCALPIFEVKFSALDGVSASQNEALQLQNQLKAIGVKVDIVNVPAADFSTTLSSKSRSEERRVGKECRSRWSPYH